jgi:VanZ family protein
MLFYLRWLLCAGYAVLIVFLSLLPARQFDATMKLIPLQDKGAHFVVYGILAVLLAWAARARKRGWPGYGFAVGLAIIYGVMMEFGQMAVSSSRVFCLADIAADAVGAGVCVGVYVGMWWIAGSWLEDRGAGEA